MAAGDNLDETGKQILMDAESELVRQEVHEKGGVIRGSTAAKVQVRTIMLAHWFPQASLLEPEYISTTTDITWQMIAN